MKRALGALSRAINSYLPGSLPNESLCGHAARSLGEKSLICRLIDAVLGEGHCREEQDWLRK